MLVTNIIISILAIILAITVVLQSVWIHSLRRDLDKAFSVLDSLLYPEHDKKA